VYTNARTREHRGSDFLGKKFLKILEAKKFPKNAFVEPDDVTNLTICGDENYEKK
jgi:hypothetical protein